MKAFSTAWNSSKSPRKQHKYRYNAPLHLRKEFLKVHLSKDLRKKHGKRSMTVRKGDTIIILRGQFTKKTGTVARVGLKKSEVFVNGIEREKKDGSKALYPVQPSNIMITEFSIDDKKRQKIVSRKKK